jgi:hypothetical protein
VVGSSNLQVIVKGKRLPKYSHFTVDIIISDIEGSCMNYKGFAMLVLCIALIACAGCSGLGSAGSVSSPQTAYSGDSSSRSMSEAKMSYAGNGAPMPVPTMAPTHSAESGAIETKIIKTASLTIEVKDVPGSIESLKVIAATKGGYLSSTNVQKNYNNQLTGTVIIRIPQAEFENALTGVKTLGTVKSASTQGEDVTEEYVDLQAQKTSYQNQLVQYNEIMKKAVKISDVIEIQAQIDNVQTNLNRLEGRLKYLNSRIDLSTITVYLQEPEPIGGETGHNFASDINEGVAGFMGMLGAIIVISITLIPLVILLGIIYGIYRWNKGRIGTIAPEEKKEIK